MELIQDIYEPFDALPAIDKEYDHPIVKAAVEQLIAQELSQTPDEILNNYDAFLASRYSNLWTVDRIEESMRKFERTSQVTNRKIDCQDYTTLVQPDISMENNVQAWRNAVARAKICYLHQENQLINLEIAEELGTKDMFLAQNSALEAISEFYGKHSQEVNREIHETQKKRVSTQERFYPQLVKYTAKRDESILRKIQCEHAFHTLKNYLAQKGYDYSEYLQELEREKEEVELRRLQDARVNSTVREYENVMVEDAEDDEEDTDTKHVDKRARRL